MSAEHERLQQPRAPLLVLGLGNVLCADDGAGVEAVWRLERDYSIDDRVRVIDGGTLGLALLPYLETASQAILVDAVVADDPAGTIVRADGEEVPLLARQKLSAHQIGVSDLLECARMIEVVPEVTLIGIVAESVECLGKPSQAVTSRIDRLVECVAEEISSRGFRVQRRTRDDRDDRGIDDKPDRNAEQEANEDANENHALDRSRAGGMDRHRWM